MKFYDMLEESDLAKLFDRFYKTCSNAVDASFKSHGFNSPHSATSVSHNIMADQTEKEAHQRRILAIGNLLMAAKVASTDLFELGQPGNNHDGDRIKLDFAIAAVEKEFKQ